MQFDPSHKLNNDGLSPRHAEMMNRVFYARRAEGLNVQFIREDGAIDEWSFSSRANAVAFARKIEAEGLKWCFSE